jgi:nucleoprotein TPR
MVENIIQQRDLYKSMCTATQKETPANAPAVQAAKKTPEKSEGSNDARAQELEKQLQELRDEFADYKKEKSENCNMLEKDLNRMREELFEAKSQASKLASHEEYNNEKFKILQTNCQGYKRQVEALELRNKQLDVIAAKHEVSVNSLREELSKAFNQVSGAEFKVNSLTQQVSHLKSAEARLLAEREVLYKERSSTSKILANLQQIQLNLERKEEEETARLRSENAALATDVGMLRKKLEEEQNHFRESVKNWENTNQELREKADHCQQSEKSALEQLNVSLLIVVPVLFYLNLLPFEIILIRDLRVVLGWEETRVHKYLT